MRTLKSFLLISVACAALGASLSACSSSDSGSGTTGGNTATTGNAATGATAYTKMSAACDTCHGADAGGSLGPNISGAATVGLGGWTEEQFYQVVRNGKLPSGKTVCQFMVKYTAAEVSDQDIADIFAFTQSKMVTTAQAGTYVGSDPTCANK